MATFKEYLKRKTEVDHKVKAFVHFDDAVIEKRARDAKKGRLEGVPVALKDNICVKGELTTCASQILKGFRPPYNATVVEKLEAEGAILFGKVNMDEFAFGSSCETSCYGPTYNPWDITRIPGGSSGGAAAAVASGQVPMAARF
jgi:aspartyl-tRNA(Asn)/glutamyl-tRNA(Gln) amidotransferase subunit A